MGEAELALAKQLIQQISADSYDPTQFVDEEKQRILAAVEEKIAGKQVVAPAHRDTPVGAEIVDLVAALRASLQATAAPAKRSNSAVAPSNVVTGERKPVRRAKTRATSDAVSSGRPAGKR